MKNLCVLLLLLEGCYNISEAESPNCEQLQAEDRFIQAYEAGFGPLTGDQLDCLRSYKVAVLEQDRLEEVCDPNIPLRQLQGCYEEETNPPTLVISAIAYNPGAVYLHELTHHLEECLTGNADGEHESDHWRIQFDSYKYEVGWSCTE